MYAGVLAVIVKGTVDAGGFSAVFQFAQESGRFGPLLDPSPNPFQYFSPSIALVGGFGFWLAQYGLNQIAVQRYSSLPSLKAARIVAILTAFAYAVLVTMCSYIGQ